MSNINDDDKATKKDESEIKQNSIGNQTEISLENQKNDISINNNEKCELNENNENENELEMKKKFNKYGPALKDPLFDKFKGLIVRPEITLTEPIEFSTDWGSFVSTPETIALFDDIGGLPRLVELFSRFYEKMFVDPEMQKFVTDPSENHAERFAWWLAEKMTGERHYWTERRPYGARQRAHSQAWHSSKREQRKRGWHFKLNDCVNWMRLNFWAVREAELDQHRVFFTWYRQFITHFIAVYERSAPPRTKPASRWSRSLSSIETYLENDRKMIDLYD